MKEEKTTGGKPNGKQMPQLQINSDEVKPVENYEINYILKNSFGFGGLNCCSVIKKWTE